MAHVDQLLAEVDDYCGRYGVDNVARVSAKTLWKYYRYNVERGAQCEALLSALQQLPNPLLEQNLAIDAGVTVVTREQIAQDKGVDFGRFAKSRHSIRSFRSDAIDPAALEQAIEAARHSPSACNRQAWKVHVFTEPQEIKGVLAYQVGNRGFGDSARAILIVTCELGAFVGTREHNQAYIDGGMFAMSLVYALHGLGLATCCLNLSLQYYEANLLRQAVSIPASEALIMMIAVGHLPEQVPITCSYRKPVSEIAVYHGADGRRK
jgi:nitroreductase